MPMVRRCHALNCQTYYAPHKNMATLFKFPREPKRCWQWLKNSGNRALLRLKLENLRHRHLCSAHFEGPAFLNKYRRKLQPNAVPTLFNNQPLRDDEMTQWLAVNRITDINTPEMLEVKAKLILPPLDFEPQIIYRTVDLSIPEQDAISNVELEETVVDSPESYDPPPRVCRLCATEVDENDFVPIFTTDTPERTLLLASEQVVTDTSRDVLTGKPKQLLAEEQISGDTMEQALEGASEQTSSHPGKQTLVDKINSLISQKVEEGDSLPQQICQTCFQKVNDCCEALEMFEETDKKLRETAREEDPQDGDNGSQGMELEEVLSQFLVQNGDVRNLRVLVPKDVPQKFRFLLPKIEGLKIPEVHDIAKKEACRRAVRQREIPCLLCGETFPLRVELYRHERMFHHFIRIRPERKVKDAVGRLMCCKCRLATTDQFEMLRHVKECDVPLSFSCEVCGDSFPYKKGLFVHRMTHGTLQTPACNICYRTFGSKARLRAHQREHHFRCKECGKVLRTKGLAERHAGVHKNVMNLCQFCGKLMKSSSYLKTHILVCHSGDNRVECPFCGKKLASVIVLRNHMKRLHGPNGREMFQCEKCSKVFISKVGFEGHQRVHSSLEVFKCDICDKEFKTPLVLLTHKKTHFLNTQEEENSVKILFKDELSST